MKNAFLVICLILSFTYLGKSQIIESENTGLGMRYYQNNIMLTMSDLTKAVKPNEEAYKLMIKAKNQNVFSQVIGGVGGFMIGWPLGASLAGSEMNYKLLAVGLGIVIVSIPISISSRKKTQKAVDIYNSSLSQSFNSKFSPNFNFFVKDSGIGIRMTF